MIQEGETNNEISSVLEKEEAVENVRSDGEDNKKKVPMAEAIKTSVISEEDAAEIMKRISQRNSMLQKSQNNSFAGANVPNKSMIDATIAPLVNEEVRDVMIVEEEDENVNENSRSRPTEAVAVVLDEQAANGSPRQDDDFVEVTPVEAVYDDDLDPAVRDEEIGDDELLADIAKREAVQRDEHDSQ